MNSSTTYGGAVGGRISRYVYLFCVVLMCYTSFVFYPRWKQHDTEAAISWDVSGYYWYLPSVFIYHDLKHQAFKDSVLNRYHPTGVDFQQGLQVANGNYVMKYSSGMAFMYLPFFTAAHLVAGALGYPRDGFSSPYQIAVQLGGLLVALFGIWYLRKLLLMYYRDRVVAVVMLLLVLGTNYLNYSAIDSGMTHSWLFTLYVFLILNTIYFYRDYELKYAVRIGLLVGLATLTRPTDIISCLIPMLWGMDSISPAAIRDRLMLFAKQYKALLITAVCAACVVSIQLIYWKYATGHWLSYSYQDQKLYFRSPFFMNYTFSYRSGWLLYTPLMMLAWVGIIPFLLNGKNRVAIVTFFLVNYYVVCIWSIWWYGGRAMIQSYPVLMFCLASLVDVALCKKGWLVLLVPIVALCIYFNGWLIYQQHVGTLYDSETMNEAYFWRVAGRWHVPEQTVFLMDKTEVYEPEPRDKKLVYQNDFADSAGVMYRTDTQKKSVSLLLTKEHEWSPVFAFPLSSKDRWLRVQATFHCEGKEYEVWKMTQFIVQVMSNGQKTTEHMIRVYRDLVPFETKSMNVDMQLPRGSYDSIHVLFWNGGGANPMYISDVKAWTFNE